MDHDVSAADIARLAGVQRPVVSMWRRRYRSTHHPFPTPRMGLRGTERFDRSEVLGWLSTTGRQLASSDPADLPRLTTFDPEALGLTALPSTGDTSSAIQAAAEAVASALALAARSGTIPLSKLDTDDLLDLLDDLDPDGRSVSRDLLSCPAWPRVTAYADGLADACYSYGAAMEWLLGQPGTLPPAWATHRLDPRLIGLVAAIAASLADEIPSGQRVFAEVGRGGSDLTQALWAGPEADTDASFHLDDSLSSAARLGRLRALANRQAVEPLSFDGLEPLLPASVVALVSLPAPDDAALGAEEVLRRLEAIETALPDQGRAVVVGPAAALCDTPREDAAARIQDRLIRRGRLRAVLRLPMGMAPGRPREQLGLWVLGRIQEQESLRHETVATGCLAPESLVSAREALIDDLRVASDARALSPRGMVVLRRIRLADILAGNKPLAPRRPWPADSALADSTAESPVDLVLLRQRLDDLAVGVAGRRFTPLPIDAQSPRRGELPTIGSLARNRELRVLPGASAEGDHDPTGDVAVVRATDLTNAETREQRTSRGALLAAGLAHRLTRPSDVIFVARPRPYAVVDHTGGRLVLAPARILRITDESEGLLPEALAVAVNDRAPGDDGWREWPVLLVPAKHRSRIEAGLAALDEIADQAQRLLDTVTAVRRDAVFGAAYHHVCVTPTPSDEETSPHAP